MNNNILILTDSLASSVQDLGRKGYRSFGVPIAGTMDKFSAILANKLLNNEEGLAVMEMTLNGPKMMFEDKTFIVLTGADLSPSINDQPIHMNTVYPVQTSDVLSFGKRMSGVRCYLGVKGGFQTEFVMNSYSFYAGITKKSLIGKGDRIPIAECEENLQISGAKIKVKKSHFNAKKLEATKGPEFHLLSKKDRETLFDTEFELVANDRMAYQLKPEVEPLKTKEIITSVTIPGTVQMTPSGKLIIMMRDCPTTGGYPRILQLTDMAINQLAQKRQGDRFKLDLESNFEFLGRLVSRFRD